MSELKPGTSSTSGTYRPHWRSDASGAGQTVTYADIYAFKRRCMDLALAWPSYDCTKLSDLIDCLEDMADTDRERVFDLTKTWLASNPTDDDIVILREHVRVRTVTGRAAKRKKGNSTSLADGKALFDLLEPRGLLAKHQWLFANTWIDYTPEELEAEEFNFEARDELIRNLRSEALREILKEEGVAGLIRLCQSGDTAFTIGWILGRDILSEDALLNFASSCLKHDDTDQRKLDNCVSGILHQFGDDEYLESLEELVRRLEDGAFAADCTLRALLAAPFSRRTWDYLCRFPEEIQQGYWHIVIPQWRDQSPEDMNYLVERLIVADRPRSILDVAQLAPDRVETDKLLKLLKEVATNSVEPIGDARFSGYMIERILESLNARTDVDRSELARLEFIYIRALTPFSKYGTPNLSRELARSPTFFVQTLAMCFKRIDSGDDPADWQMPEDKEDRRSAATNAYYLLDNANIIPGQRSDGSIDLGELRNWVRDARRLAATHGRAVIADQQIGKLLSTCKAGEDGVWPVEEVRTVIEECASKEMSTGLEIGVYNSRGAGFRGPDGTEERALAEKYRGYAMSVMNKTPFVGRMLLNIAESYDRDAKREDSEGKIRRRLRG